MRGTIVTLVVAVLLAGYALGNHDEPAGESSAPPVAASTDPYPQDPSNEWFGNFSPEQQTAYVDAYHYCDDAQKDFRPEDVVEYAKERETAADDETSIAAAEFEGCSDGNSETPLEGSGIPYPSDEAFGG